jgi:hypothetical protein
MANEVQKSIQISYKADLKDLMAKLKQIPNVTDQEAKKMVSALDRQLKQAEKAAKKSADASKKAAKEAGMAATRGAKDFDDLADSARRAEEKLEHVADTSGDIDRGFSSMGLALRGVNPQLAEAADGIADAFAVTEGLTMSFKSLNPYVIAGAVAIGALTLGYTAYQAELQRVIQETLDLRDAQKALLETQNQQQSNLEDGAFKIRQQRNEYKLLTGQISQYEFNLEQAGETAHESFRGNIESAKNTAKETDLLLQNVKSLIAANSRNTDVNVVLSEAEKERIRTAQLLTVSAENSLDLTQRGLKERIALSHVEDALEKQLFQEVKATKALEEMQKEAKNTAMSMVELQKELADATEEQANSKEKIVGLQEDEGDNLRNLIELDQQRFNRQQNASMELDRIAEELLLTDEERKNQAFQDELDRIAELGVQSNQVGKARMLVEEKINQARQDGVTAYMEQQKQLMNDTIDQGQEVFGSLEQFAKSAMDLAKENGRANAKVMKILFRMAQIGAIGDIAFTAAKEVTKALALPKGLRGIRIGTIAATAAAQSGIVMAQQMPEATFHMGGMAPDEMGARVLQGEAVLDRATVQRIGGEEGVQQLQQGGGMNSQVVVIQPFRHFGRFAREIGFRPQKQTGIRAY